MATIELCRKAALDALRPPPALALADWIESNIFLPSTVSATPGRMRLWAYQRGICEALDDPEISRVTILKSARIGYTSLLTAVIGANVANSPAPILVVQPTSDDARDYATGDVDGVFDASPALRGLLREDADENGRSTMLNRRFPGGSVKFVAARSPRTLRRHNVKILLMDEIDGFEMTAEGDPISVAEKRTLAFRDRKIVAGSTPVFDHGPASRL